MPKIDTNFQTPPSVAAYMVSMIPSGTKKILEPTPGVGNISSLLHGGGVFCDNTKGLF